MTTTRAELVTASTASIERGSKSFAAAARLFDRSTRESVVMLYAWCRHCDDVIDGQTAGHGALEGDRSGAAARLDELRALTRQACRGEPTGVAVFDALGEVVREHAIPEALPLDHLDGFAMDAGGRHYGTLPDTLAYCYHVAGVVGVMMARLMGVRDTPTLDRACDLGIAFQLTNIARDLVEDARIDRVYLPADWLAEAGLPRDDVAAPARREALAGLARRLVATAEPYYASARVGVRALPFRSAWAIATALGVYRAIGTSVRRRGAHAWDERVSTSTAAKLAHVAGGAAVAMGLSGLSAAGSRTGLWTRPRREAV